MLQSAAPFPLKFSFSLSRFLRNDVVDGGKGKSPCEMRTAALDTVGDQLARARKLDDRFQTHLSCLAKLSSQQAMLRVCFEVCFAVARCSRVVAVSRVRIAVCCCIFDSSLLQNFIFVFAVASAIHLRRFALLSRRFCNKGIHLKQKVDPPVSQ